MQELEQWAATGRTEPLRRYRFSSEIRRELLALHKLDNWHGLVAVLTDYLVIGAAIFAVESASGPLASLLYVCALPVIATRFRAFTSLMHESSHGILAKSRWLNRFFATYCSSYLVLLPRTSPWPATHVKGHHKHFGDPIRDPDLKAQIDLGIHSTKSEKEFTQRHLIAPILGLRTHLFIKGALTGIWGNFKSSDRREVAQMLLFVSTLFGAVVYWGGGRLLLLYWLVPLLAVCPLIHWYTELVDHFPLLPCSARTDVEASRHRAVGFVTRHLLGIHNEGYHLDHHLSPGIPFWNLPKAHKIRMKDAFYADWIRRSTGLRGNRRAFWWQLADLGHYFKGTSVQRFEAESAAVS